MQSTIVFLLAAAGIAVLCLLLSARDRKQSEAALRRELRESFGRAPKTAMSPQRYARVPARYLRHLPEDAVDDITWNDLDMDLVYARINAARSGAGEEYLYALLRSPIRGEEGRTGREEPGKTASSNAPDRSASRRNLTPDQIRWFEEPENEEPRLRLQIALSRFGHASRYSIYEYLDALDRAKAESSLRHLPAFLLPALSLALLCVSVPAGVLCLILSLVLNMITYYRRRGEIEPYLVSFSWLLKMLRCADEIMEIPCPAIQEEQKELKSLRPAFAKFRRGSGLLLSGAAVSGGNILDLVLDYIRILFHIDLIKFNTMLSEAGSLTEEIDAELTLLGKIDTAISLASFEKSLPYSCVPEFSETGTAVFAAEELYHPLLENPVANSLTADRPILLTGSNASGKSTFLKAAALCALLAQTIGLCPARSYHGSVFRVRTSMALRDSIRDGESYFMVEIRSLKRIADLAEDGGKPVLCCIDEVLRGTNTIERIAASSEILEALAGKNILCMAATHDIELTDILHGSYDNYHFEEELAGGDVVFSYQLRKGAAETRNALRLLDVLGFDEDLVERAARRAERFERTGQWNQR